MNDSDHQVANLWATMSYGVGIGINTSSLLGTITCIFDGRAVEYCIAGRNFELLMLRLLVLLRKRYS
jgi:hypothetical protein